MGVLSKEGQIDAGLFSLVDFLDQRDKLEMLGTCIATRDQVKSVMLFSNHGWKDLDGRTIGITDETATSVQLLRVLLKKKYGVDAKLQRMHSGVNNFSEFDAVLLIGDEALRHNKVGLHGFELTYDLATEWYTWQQLPFVFAVWAVKKSIPEEQKTELKSLINDSLTKGETELARISLLPSRQLGLSVDDAVEYLEGFNYRIGEREKQALETFEKLLSSLEVVQA
jgi:chorismate dehydratase